mmetsp:Transcript_14068/g.21936  ORF Transcript_14068/g.21936 Transcript_14068/m.21936 type:complete len:119 (+) Transcript_14068:611-967(+)
MSFSISCFESQSALKSNHKSAASNSHISTMIPHSINIEEIKDLSLHFQTSMLRLLEPIWLEDNTPVQKQMVTVDQIIFLMDGKVEVGYNHHYFMFEKGLTKNPPENHGGNFRNRRLSF